MTEMTELKKTSWIHEECDSPIYATTEDDVGQCGCCAKLVIIPINISDKVMHINDNWLSRAEEEAKNRQKINPKPSAEADFELPAADPILGDAS